LTDINDAEEWIRAGEVAQRIGEGCTMSLVGRYAAKKLLTRNETDKTYPWPKVKQEWYLARETTNQKAPSIQEAQIEISSEEVTNIINIDRLIELMQEGDTGAPGKAYQYARALNEMIKVRQGQLKIKDSEGRTLDVEAVEKWVFNLSRQNKEFWLNWPEIVSVRMAEELEIDSRKLNAVLKKYVRNNLEKVATLPDEYG